MQLDVREPLKKSMSVVDFLNPYIVIISIIGLILEYTSVPDYVPFLVYFNQGVDVYFLLEFIFRMIAYTSAKKYFTKNYGWVDMLAGIPGLMVFFGGGGLLGLVKITRVGKFFKMIRILRFLRMFSFMKKMKSDSPYIQDRLMKTGVSTVLVVIAGLFLVDFFNTSNFLNMEKEKINKYIQVESREAFLNNLDAFDIPAYKKGDEYKSIES
ncbi:MAG: ion transporter [Spirochaetota bacterium]